MMRLKYEFEPVDMGDEIILVPVGENAKQVQGIIKVNQAGKEVLDLIATGNDEDGIIDSLSEKYQEDRETIKGKVQMVLDYLRELNIIDE